MYRKLRQAKPGEAPALRPPSPWPAAGRAPVLLQDFGDSSPRPPRLYELESITPAYGEATHCLRGRRSIEVVAAEKGVLAGSGEGGGGRVRDVQEFPVFVRVFVCPVIVSLGTAACCSDWGGRPCMRNTRARVSPSAAAGAGVRGSGLMWAQKTQQVGKGWLVDGLRAGVSVSLLLSSAHGRRPARYNAFLGNASQSLSWMGASPPLPSPPSPSPSFIRTRLALKNFR